MPVFQKKAFTPVFQKGVHARLRRTMGLWGDEAMATSDGDPHVASAFALRASADESLMRATPLELPRDPPSARIASFIRRMKKTIREAELAHSLFDILPAPDQLVGNFRDGAAGLQLSSQPAI